MLQALESEDLLQDLLDKLTMINNRELHKKKKEEEDRSDI